MNKIITVLAALLWVELVILVMSSPILLFLVGVSGYVVAKCTLGSGNE